VSDSSKDKEYLDKVDPERREFVRKMVCGSGGRVGGDA